MLFLRFTMAAAPSGSAQLALAITATAVGIANMKIISTRNTNLTQATHALRVVANAEQQTIQLEYLNAKYEDGDFNQDNPEYSVTASSLIDVAALRSGYDWADHSVFACGYSVSPDGGTLTAPFPLLAESLLLRNDLRGLSAKRGQTFPFLLLVPHANCSFEELSLVCVAPATHGHVEAVGAEVVEQSTDSVNAMMLGLLPQVSLSAQPAQAGDVIDVEATVTGIESDKEVTVYFESVGGAVVTQRVQTVGGIARAKVLTAGLSSGDSVRVKAGFKFFPSKSDITIQLV
jgi:hypothetical protein